VLAARSAARRCGGRADLSPVRRLAGKELTAAGRQNALLPTDGPLLRRARRSKIDARLERSKKNEWKRNILC
jgi:hypothetical protein